MTASRICKVLILLILLQISQVLPAHAQQEDPAAYIVQSGDTLTSIAVQFGISTKDLIQANDISDPNSLAPGDRLILPGYEGVRGTLAAQTVGIGQSIKSISRQYHIPIDTILKLNQITSPAEVYAGSSLIVPQSDTPISLNSSEPLAPGEPLLVLAAIKGRNPWEIANDNGLDNPQVALPGDLLFYTSGTQEENTLASTIPWVEKIEITPLPLVQGRTVEITVKSRVPIQATGSLMGKDLHFFQTGGDSYAALTGVHALSDPGPYPLDLKFQTQDGSSYQVEQPLLTVSGNYPQDPRLIVDPATIDPKITGPENEQVFSITAPVTQQKLWDGVFLSPAYDPKWITSWFGDRRYYNEDPTLYFHTGLDYGGGVGLPIKAPAAGVVVFAGPLTVRGNATIVDHGWGVYSAYYHQSKINVQVGDTVQPGQVIGLIGGTGRVTGAHLHWEIWVNGIQVEPLDWLEQAYP